MRLGSLFCSTVLLWGLTVSTGQAGESKFTDLQGNPGLRSASAIVLDSDGNLIYGKDVDTVRPIASITKL
jgi:D-alanyl-D-alanine endopeptidase (penicillin-binding protein 7)